MATMADTALITNDRLELTTVLQPQAMPAASGMGLDSQTRRQAALVALGRRAIAPPEMALLIHDGAALLAETLQIERYGAFELDPAGRKLVQKLAKTGAARDQFIESRVDFDERLSIAALAIKSARVIVVPDLSAKSPANDRFLATHGVRSALVVGLQLAGESYGAIGAFSSRRSEFSEADRLFAETIAHLLSTTIGRDRTLRKLDDARRLNNAILSTVEALVLMLDRTGRILTINEASERTTGFTLAELAERPIWNTLLVHDDLAAFQQSFNRAASSSEPVEIDSSVLTKSGERRQIRWNLAATRDARGEVASVLGTGLDITRQRVAEQQVGRLAAVAKSALEGKAPSMKAALPATAARQERRQRTRQAFNFLQRIAPIVDGKLPERRQFHAVHCKDISSGGFSFLANTPPPHSSFVVALGTAPAITYLTADVVHVTSVIRNDKTRYLVGCKYVGRADHVDKPANSRP